MFFLFFVTTMKIITVVMVEKLLSHLTSNPLLPSPNGNTFRIYGVMTGKMPALWPPQDSPSLSFWSVVNVLLKALLHTYDIYYVQYNTNPPPKLLCEEAKQQ